MKTPAANALVTLVLNSDRQNSIFHSSEILHSTALNDTAMQNPLTINLDRKELRLLIHDNVKSAEVLHLVYVNDSENGIRRIMKNDKFVYKINNVEIR